MRILLRILIPIVLFHLHWFASAAERPNVILIMADDLGYRDLGCYGHEQIRTPVLDRMAAGGMRLTNFHSGASVCTPSRMALLTGAYPVRLGWTQGVVGYLIPGDEGMNPEALTMAEIFRSAGYATGISGKWHIGSGPATGPLAQGFDEAYHLKLSNNQTKKVWQGENGVDEPFDNRLLTERFTKSAVQFIRAKHGQPYFLYLPYTAPHFPVQAHPDWDGGSSFGAYGDVVEEMDFRIGEILKVLDELGEQEKTLVIFTSDNGPQKNEAARATPFRGAKWSALEGGTRVPCILHWPGVVAAGQVSDKLVGAIDLLPSISRACGIDWQRKSEGKPMIDGMDVWDTLAGQGKEHPRHSLLHWQGKSPAPIAVTHDSWKLFFNGRDAFYSAGTDLGTPEQTKAATAVRESLGKENHPMLFNLATDVGEVIDVSSKNPEKVKELLDIATRLMADLAEGKTLPLAKSKAME